jgi:hypothetical protein
VRVVFLDLNNTTKELKNNKYLEVPLNPKQAKKYFGYNPKSLKYLHF